MAHMVTVFVLVCLVATGLLVVAEARSSATLRPPAKIIAAVAFVAAAVAAGSPSAPGGFAIMAGLTLSVVGDVALLWRDKRVFLVGILAFLLGHVAYVFGFVAIGVDPLGLVGGLVISAVLGVVMWRWLSPHAGELRGAVAAYILVIAVMVAAAFGAWIHDIPAKRRLFMLVGAIFFFVSDITVARDRFVKREFRNKLVGTPMYFIAQLMIGVPTSWV
jgi:uncharacterized membrane protein YhhN